MDIYRLRYRNARQRATHALIQKCQAKGHIYQNCTTKKRATFVALFHISYTDNYIISELYYSSTSSATSSASSGTGSNAFTLRLIFLSAALHSTTAASTVSPTL